MNQLNKTIKQLSKDIADHLGLDELPIKFEDLGDEDSRIYFKDEYISINTKYKNNYEECAKCLTHEYRHVFQIFYANLFQTETAVRWKSLLPSVINSSNIKKDGTNYISQELEIDAFAFTKFYLGHYENIKVVNRINGLDDVLNLYIEKNIKIM